MLIGDMMMNDSCDMNEVMLPAHALDERFGIRVKPITLDSFAVITQYDGYRNSLALNRDTLDTPPMTQTQGPLSKIPVAVRRHIPSHAKPLILENLPLINSHAVLARVRCGGSVGVCGV